MKKTYFISDERARIPFSIIGVFLILGSSFTSVYVTKLETDKTRELASTIGFNEVENLIRLAEADISTALNIAGLKAIKILGEKPIIEAFSTKYGTDPDTVSKNLVREYLMDEINVYLKGNYLYDAFNDGKYSTNVLIESNSDNPVDSWDQINFRELSMQLERPMEIPLLSPPKKVTHETYWILNLPLTVEIRQLDFKNPGRRITTRTINVSTIITSRYLLLKNLVDKDYFKTINGVHELWSFTTILSNIYSLARGYKHYQTGKPENVFDNKHLALIVNAGLLLEQSFVFGSVDPMGLLQLANNTYKTLKNKKSNEKDLLNLDLGDSDGYEMSSSDLSEGSANTDSGEDFNNSINTCPEIDLAEIARKPLYSVESVYINFLKPDGTSFKKELFYPFTEDDIADIIKYYENMGYTFADVTTAKSDKNPEAVDKVIEIIKKIYKSKIKTKITRDTSPTIIYGDHSGYSTDNGTSDWFFSSIALKDTTDKPSKGEVHPICTLYSENYDLKWQREHYWSKKIGDNWYHYTATDTKKEEVKAEIILNFYSLYNNTKNDVKDIFYTNTYFDDLNLEDTLDTYLNSFYYPNKNTLIQTGSGEYYNEFINGFYKPWVELECWDCLDEIYAQISLIKQDPDLNSNNYPNTYELLELIKEDILLKYDSNIDIFLNKDEYVDIDEYISTGKKAVSSVREWYVYLVRSMIVDFFEEIENEIDKNIDDIIPDGSGFNAEDIKDTLSSEAMAALKDQFVIPFGFDMSLKRYKNSVLEWDEIVRLAVDQYPDYLTPFKETEYEGKTIQTMGLRNICTLGPTGLPILPPTPVTPWIITINVWLIDVKGEYCEFKVIDTTDETLFNPIFGHDPQIYVRKEESVYNMKNDTLVGKNTRLKYGFNTVAFSVVPSWGYMVGDWGAYSEEDGWS